MDGIRRIRYVIRSGFKGAWQHRGMGIASITSITAVLVILGFVLIGALGINNIIGDTQKKVDDIEIFLKVGATPNIVKAIQQDLEADRRVVKVTFKTSKDALESMREDLGDKANLLDNLGEDVLPASFSVKINEINDAKDFVEEYKNREGVDTIGYYKDLIEKITQLANYGKIAAFVIMLGLVLLAFFVISNTVKLTVIARHKEIGVMRHLGARNGFIEGPFIIEGVIFGLIAAGLSFVIVYFGYSQMFTRLNDAMGRFFYASLVRPVTIQADLAIIFVALGVGIGIIGSLFSMKKYLKV